MHVVICEAKSSRKMQRHVDPVWTWPPKIPGKNQAEAGHVPSYPEKQGYLRVQKDLD